MRVGAKLPNFGNGEERPLLYREEEKNFDQPSRWLKITTGEKGSKFEGWMVGENWASSPEKWKRSKKFFQSRGKDEPLGDTIVA